MQLDSYSFHFADNAGRPRIFLLPLLDLLNHAQHGNAEVRQDRSAQQFVAVALRDIRHAAPLPACLEHE